MSTVYSDFMVALRQKLINSDYVSPLIGGDIGSDTMFNIESGAFNDGWIFRGQGDSGAPGRNPAHTGTSAVTLNFRTPATSTRAQFGRYGASTTARFRMLQVYIFSDVSRDPENLDLVVAQDAEDRCFRVANEIIHELNDPANNDHWWPGGVYVTACDLVYDLSIRNVTDNGSDGLVRGALEFSVVID